MEYGWNISKKETFTFGSLSREFYYASLLVDEILVENAREVKKLMEVHGARADLVLPERGAAALHVLAGLEAEDFAADVVLRALRRPGMHLDVRSEEGLTPIHVAANYGRLQIIEILLTNGADPFLLDYRLLLDAEGCAFRERQWQAYSMLATYTAIVENEEQFAKYLDPRVDLSSDIRHRISSSSSTIKGSETTKKNRTAKNSCHELNKEQNHDEIGDSTWIDKTLEVISLDENSINIIQNHRNKTETYESPLNKEELPNQPCDDRVSCVSRKNFKVTMAKKIQLQDNKLPWLSSIKNYKREKILSKHQIQTVDTTYLENSSCCDSGKVAPLNCNSSANEPLDVESVAKNINPHTSETKESEMYCFEYSAGNSSLKSTESSPGNRSSTIGFESKLESLNTTNNKILSKMSRIFLFILKKRNTTYRQLE